jgi:hypothetical protein
VFRRSPAAGTSSPTAAKPLGRARPAAIRRQITRRENSTLPAGEPDVLRRTVSTRYLTRNRRWPRTSARFGRSWRRSCCLRCWASAEHATPDRRINGTDGWSSPFRFLDLPVSSRVVFTHLDCDRVRLDLLDVQARETVLKNRRNCRFPRCRCESPRACFLPRRRSTSGGTGRAATY